MILVVPSIRNLNTDFLAPLLERDVRVLVVDDTGERTITSSLPNIEVFAYEDRVRMIGKWETCIPKKNGACRDLGLWYAYLTADSDETIVCLDDDCEVDTLFFDKAEASLGVTEVTAVDTDHRFYNCLDPYGVGFDIFHRGHPYEHRGDPYDYSYEGKVTGNVVFNLGSWAGVFDVNAVDKLQLSQYAFPDATLRFAQVAVPKGSLTPLSSMNMIFKKELIPAIYQLPMNEYAIPHWGIDRYGDIWGGYICKLLADIKGDLITVGEPMIMHHQEDTHHGILKNIQQEHYSHIVDLHFCDLIKEACAGIESSDYLSMYESFVDNISASAPPPALKSYLEPTTQKMRYWAEALRHGTV